MKRRGEINRWSVKDFMKGYRKRRIAIFLCICLTALLVFSGVVFVLMHKKDIKEGEYEMEVKRFQSHFQFSCNVYVVSSEKGNILIDPGHYDKRIRDYINHIGGLDAVLLTHGHWDHTYGLDSLKKDFPDVPVYIAKDAHDFLTNPDLNGSAWNGFDEIVKSEVTDIQEGDLRIAGYDIDVISTPGHCRRCVLYYFKNEEVLFTGDTIMRDVASPIRPTGSEEDQKNSIRKFINLGYRDDTPVYPGHGAETTYGYLIENNVEVKGVRQ